jgi:hypothetical protein
MLDIHLTDLHFHQDYDGMVAAAMVYANLTYLPTLHAAQYSTDLHWLSRDLGDSPAIVDFLFHPSAKLWIDHHHTTFLEDRHAAEFVPDDLHVLDQTAPSCPDIIQRLPWFEVTEHWREYVRWSNIIDAARYGSPAEANDVSNPHLMLSRLIAEISDQSLLVQLVDAITTRSVEEVLRIKDVQSINDSLVRREVELREVLLKTVRIVGDVAILNQSSHRTPYRRYIAYERYPEVHYGIGIYRNDSGFVVSVGENPWNRSSNVDLGALCKEFGGGGRKSTAGVPVTSAKKGVDIAEVITQRLNESTR